jgi:hypothetical protein
MSKKPSKATLRFVSQNQRRIGEEKECGKKKRVTSLAKQARRLARHPGENPEQWCELINFGYEEMQKLIKTISGTEISVEEFGYHIKSLRSADDLYKESKFKKRVARKLNQNEQEAIDSFVKTREYKKMAHKVMMLTSDPNTPCRAFKRYLPKSKMLRGWEALSVIGRGKFGVVFLMQRGKTQRVLKIVQDKKTSFNSPKVEVQIQTVAAAAGIAPKIRGQIERYIGTDGLHRIMFFTDSLDITLSSYLRCIELTLGNDLNAKQRLWELIVVALFALMTKMKKLNMTHSDMHTENVMLGFESADKLKIQLIDFGQSSLKECHPSVDVSQLLRTIRMDNVSRECEDYFDKRMNRVLEILEDGGDKDGEFIEVSGEDFEELSLEFSDPNTGVPNGFNLKQAVRAAKRLA